MDPKEKEQVYLNGYIDRAKEELEKKEFPIPWQTDDPAWESIEEERRFWS